MNDTRLDKGLAQQAADHIATNDVELKELHGKLEGCSASRARAQLRKNIDANLDERLRLMGIRDGAEPADVLDLIGAGG